MSQKQKIAVQPGELAELIAEATLDQVFQPFFLCPRQVMVPDIGRVRNNEVKALTLKPRRLRFGKIAVYNVESGVFPQFFCSLGKACINFKALCCFDFSRAECLQKRGEKGAGTDGGL